MINHNNFISILHNGAKVDNSEIVLFFGTLKGVKNIGITGYLYTMMIGFDAIILGYIRYVTALKVMSK